MSFAVFGVNIVKAEKKAHQELRRLEMNKDSRNDYMKNHLDEISDHLANVKEFIQDPEQYQRAFEEMTRQILRESKPVKVSVLYDGLQPAKEYRDMLVKQGDKTAHIKQKYGEVDMAGEPILNKSRTSQKMAWRLLN